MHPESLERFVLVTQFFSAPVISFSRSHPIHNDPVLASRMISRGMQLVVLCNGTPDTHSRIDLYYVWTFDA